MKVKGLLNISDLGLVFNTTDFLKTKYMVLEYTYRVLYTTEFMSQNQWPLGAVVSA